MKTRITLCVDCQQRETEYKCSSTCAECRRVRQARYRANRRQRNAARLAAWLDGE